MTRQAHDALAKQFLADLLEPLGRSISSLDVADEPRQVDVFFEPAFPPVPAPELLGTIARIASVPCALEVFRNAPTIVEFQTCLLKLYTLRAGGLRRARRDRKPLSENALPPLWVLSPTLSPAFLKRFAASDRPDWLPGVYSTPDGYRAHLVAIHQLPATPETLMLRVLGRGQVQRAAIEEVRSLPGSPTIERVLALLENWRYTIQLRENRSEDEEEVLMNLSPAYLRWREAHLQEGRQEGLQEGRQEGRLEGLQAGRRETIETALRVRFGGIDPELARIIPALLALPLGETMGLVMTGDRAQLLKHFENY
ncbi:hypothetical protein KR51_00003970 [Rubidibacter lacunae KORDI 51-2]|uniref:Flagellar assembly protein H n=1 Tax=Rubidibacter lacunae KORDI 51-2 TaxID=582515 RepID=U5DQH2_9CHRO|nr:hypothetical protein [Rubidibacter lacunae]ERN42869.1 hypothetical protein KR51_00003970 [Rubidibacter lacunae KORDI 51-2]